MMDLCYLAHAPEVNNIVCGHIANSLPEFHSHKHAILDTDAQVGKENQPIIGTFQSVRCFWVSYPVYGTLGLHTNGQQMSQNMPIEHSSKIQDDLATIKGTIIKSTGHLTTQIKFTNLTWPHQSTKLVLSLGREVRMRMVRRVLTKKNQIMKGLNLLR